MGKNAKAIIFALTMCLVVSMILSGLAFGLRPMQEKNIEVDVKKNILKALKVSSLEDPTSSKLGDFYSSVTGPEIEKLYAENVKSIVLNKNSKIDSAKKADKLTDKDKIDGFRPLYLHQVNGQIQAYCMPIEGKGLWSTLYGFIALAKDLNTVKGLTFYAHGETPGLGAEISADWFQNNFTGKKILNKTGDLTPVQVVKGKVVKGGAMEAHEVDGISGATITANGVNTLLQKDLGFYNKYFNTIRGGK